MDRTLKEIAEEARRVPGQGWIDARKLAYAAERDQIVPVRRAGTTKLYSPSDALRLIAIARRVAERSGEL